MRSIKALSRRVDKLENLFLFRGAPSFSNSLSDDDTTKLLCCLSKEELRSIADEADEMILEQLLESCYNKYKETMETIFASDQELKEHTALIDFIVKYMLSLSKIARPRLRDINSKESKKLDELIVYYKNNKKGLTNAGSQYRN